MPSADWVNPASPTVRLTYAVTAPRRRAGQILAALDADEIPFRKSER